MEKIDLDIEKIKPSNLIFDAGFDVGYNYPGLNPRVHNPYEPESEDYEVWMLGYGAGLLKRQKEAAANP